MPILMIPSIKTKRLHTNTDTDTDKDTYTDTNVKPVLHLSLLL